MNVNIKIPDELDAVILDALNRAQHRKRRRHYSLVSAAALLSVILLGSHSFPAFAALMRSPLEFIQTINMDIYHKLSQPVQLEQTKDGLSFTVNEIVSDQQLLFIPYSLRTRPGLKNKMNYRLTDSDGNLLLEYEGIIKEGKLVVDSPIHPGNNIISGSSMVLDEESPGFYIGHFSLEAATHYRFTEHIRLDIWFQDNPELTWTFNLVNKPVDNGVLKYAVDQNFNVLAGDRMYPVHAGELALYPTVTMLELGGLRRAGIQGFIESMYLEDDNGHRAEYKGNKTEVDAAGNYVTRSTFDSLYMYRPQALYLVIEKLSGEPPEGSASAADSPKYRLMERIKLY